jgi:aquaporin Z
VAANGRQHWREYGLEASCLGLFMLSAAGFATLLQHPSSPAAVFHLLPIAKRAVMGAAMGATAIALIYSPWGARSGAHMNPAVTLAFLRLGKIAPADAAGYIAGQFIGGTLGIAVATALYGGLPANPAVNYVATVPGGTGSAAAFVAEATIAFLMMSAVLFSSNSLRLARFTGVIAGVLVAAFILVEAPLSGMSMNPARTLGSNLLAHAAASLWIYFTAPPLGMLLAAECARRIGHASRVRCAKLHHPTNVPCIFRCGYTQPSEEIV